MRKGNVDNIMAYALEIRLRNARRWSNIPQNITKVIEEEVKEKVEESTEKQWIKGWKWQGMD